ncbi:hypothetical protein [Streptacidiphilus neutrinimicus]|uniref:hypothetical protein n=1 Tax=Streptacidiphilus neutrinimicus TaxID=105420 RepID=UPI000B248077|nr:hypothetical protein [Streptacidiphilus neutrinimicus]
MKLGKLVARGVAEDVLDATVEEAPPAPEPETTEAATVVPPRAAPVTAGSSTER